MEQNITINQTGIRTIDTALYISTIMFVVLDMPLAITNIIGNLVFIITLSKTRSLHTPSNVLLGALAVGDLIVGLFCQPCYSALLIAKITYQDYASILHIVHRTMLTICTRYSCLFSCLVSMDRYIAICHPFFYHRTATCKRNVFIAFPLATAYIGIGMLDIFPKKSPSFLIGLPFQAILAYLISLICYWRIVKVISLQRKRVAQMGTLAGEERNEQRSEKRKAYVIAVILGVFFLCYTGADPDRVERFAQTGQIFKVINIFCL